jgi:hypothetical protein
MGTIAVLERYPGVGEGVRPRIRRMLVRRFPYKLICTVRVDAVHIIAVAHGHCMPDYWQDRPE